ncbi:MAG: hypothetical protein HRT35_25070 [Algicola sp.]|nr:hypothetical protein [Algicola sp.]
MIKKLFFIALMTTSLATHSAELIRDATVIEVFNTNTNGADFGIVLEGGTGRCVSPTRTVITFPETKKQSDDSYKQSFAIALSALSTGMKVRVHNFEDNLCTGANFIAISR